jgi:hypothetical protein
MKISVILLTIKGLNFKISFILIILVKLVDFKVSFKFKFAFLCNVSDVLTLA